MATSAGRNRCQDRSCSNSAATLFGPAVRPRTEYCSPARTLHSARARSEHAVADSRVCLGRFDYMWIQATDGQDGTNVHRAGNNHSGGQRHVLTAVEMLVATAGAVLVAIWLFQRRLIYFPLSQEVPPVDTLLPGAEQAASCDGRRPEAERLVHLPSGDRPAGDGARVQRPPATARFGRRILPWHGPGPCTASSKRRWLAHKNGLMPVSSMLWSLAVLAIGGATYLAMSLASRATTATVIATRRPRWIARRR